VFRAGRGMAKIGLALASYENSNMGNIKTRVFRIDPNIVTGFAFPHNRFIQSASGNVVNGALNGGYAREIQGSTFPDIQFFSKGSCKAHADLNRDIFYEVWVEYAPVGEKMISMIKGYNTRPVANLNEIIFKCGNGFG
jgi:hypothetical protein